VAGAGADRGALAGHGPGGADQLSQRAAAGDPARLAAIFDRFERWQTARATLQVLTLLSVTWALAAEVASA
jgi:hypothetical protein